MIIYKVIKRTVYTRNVFTLNLYIIIYYAHDINKTYKSEYVIIDEHIIGLKIYNRDTILRKCFN